MKQLGIGNVQNLLPLCCCSPSPPSVGGCSFSSDIVVRGIVSLTPAILDREEVHTG